MLFRSCDREKAADALPIQRYDAADDMVLGILIHVARAGIGLSVQRPRIASGAVVPL